MVGAVGGLVEAEGPLKGAPGTREVPEVLEDEEYAGWGI
jgi:hypothetical protein